MTETAGMFPETMTKKRGRPPTGTKAMTAAERKRAQRSRQQDAGAAVTKEMFIRDIVRFSIPHFVTSHVVCGTTSQPEYKAFMSALGVRSKKKIKQVEEFFYSEKIAESLRKKMEK